MAFLGKLFKKKTTEQAFPQQQFRPTGQQHARPQKTNAQQQATPRKRSGLPAGYLNKSVF